MLVVALALFVVGAELLLSGVAALARALRVPTVLIGLTLVPLATSAPELIVSISAATAGQSELAIGEVVGTNTLNVLFILGLLALVAPLRVSAHVVRSQVPIMICVSVLMLALSYDGRISRGAGVLLLVLMVGHVAYLNRAARRSHRGGAFQDSVVRDVPGTIKGAGWVILGGAILALSAQTVVSTATATATQIGMSPHKVGLMFVAAGTSLPELATTIVAVAKGEHDLAVGNVIGSNIFNGLTVLGITAIVAPDGLAVPAAMVSFDLPVMLAAALLCYPIVLSRGVIDRWEGGVLLGSYLSYVAFAWFW